MLDVVRDTSIEKFLKECGPLLYKNEEVNSLAIGLCEMLSRAKQKLEIEPPLLRILDDERLVSVAIQTNPPHTNLLLTSATQAQMEFLAPWIIERQIEMPGVVGPVDEVKFFSDAWSRLTGKKAVVAMRQRLYRADKAILPKSKVGQMRPAAQKDVDLVTRWQVEFAEESLPLHERRKFEDTKPLVTKKIEDQWVYLWTVNDDAVAMAHVSRPTRNGVTVNCVYTPPDFRKKGYASAVVAAVTHETLKSGKKFCLLYTDLSNPTSNKIYQNVGYRELVDSQYVLFI